jgi:hypothetical protein
MVWLALTPLFVIPANAGIHGLTVSLNAMARGFQW